MKQPITLRLYALKRRQKPNGEIPIYLRLTRKGEYKYISTGFSVPEKYWHPKGYVKKTHPKSKVLNDRLNDLIFQANETMRSLPTEQRTLPALKEALTSPERKQFFIYAKHFISGLTTDKRYWAEKRTQTAVNHFRDFIDNEKITLDEISPEILRRFQSYLSFTKKHKPNTVNKMFECIKGIFRDARENDITGNDPFQSFKPVSRTASDKTRLSLEQIRAIEALQIEPGSFRAVIRDAFMFSFYNAGIRFSDICTLKWDNIINGRLQYKMAKTGGSKNIRLLEPALSILNLYKTNQEKPYGFLFPILDTHKEYSDSNYLKKQISVKNVLANRALEKIAEQAGIEDKVTFHVSRHSFADYARTSNMSIYDISKALGHSDIKITQDYLKSFDETSLDKGMEQLFHKE